ncbi:MAG: permease [Candidatus Omnitrophica bacterium]|nr:permease [Candidatus Omnitrophota bacterium]
MLEALGYWVASGLFRLAPGSHLNEVVAFFVADTVKIFFMLMALIFVIGVARTFIPHRQLRDWMSHRGFAGYFYASLFGAVTPFCSCSSIPIFFAFLKAGVPLGIMFAFLITSPIINEYVVVLMLGFFGWKIAVAYVVSGMAIGISAGILLGRMRLERHLVEDFAAPAGGSVELPEFDSWRGRIAYGWDEALAITSRIWMWVLAGVGLGAFIHNYVAQEMVRSLITTTGIFAVPLATLLGVPMYGSCAAIVPIAVALFQKGIPLGTALSFMMAVAALSLPEAVMLRRAMKLRLIMIFFGVTTAAIIATGYLFNALQAYLVV